ncbi:MAG: PEP-CTERM sorting domain-containing protein [Steroidobacteraceae bacterium]
MKRIIRPLLIILSLIAPTMTLASVTYTFEFTGINDQNLSIQNPKPDFSLTLTYPRFVTTTGLFAIEGSPLPTTLGYSVIGAGTNSLGWWGFADNTDNTLSDTGYGFVGGSFLFQPFAYTTSYLTTPGTFEGTVIGNDTIDIPGFYGYSAFAGDATLTISEPGVPEPSTVSLFAVGLVAVLVSRRRNIKRG